VRACGSGSRGILSHAQYLSCELCMSHAAAAGGARACRNGSSSTSVCADVLGPHRFEPSMLPEQQGASPLPLHSAASMPEMPDSQLAPTALQQIAASKSPEGASTQERQQAPAGCAAVAVAEPLELSHPRPQLNAHSSTTMQQRSDEISSRHDAKVVKPGDVVVLLTGQLLGSTGQVVSVRDTEAIVHLACGLRSMHLDDIRPLERSPETSKFSPEASKLVPLARANRMAVLHKSPQSPESGSDVAWSIPSEASPTPSISPPCDMHCTPPDARRGSSLSFQEVLNSSNSTPPPRFEERGGGGGGGGGARMLPIPPSQCALPQTPPPPPLKHDGANVNINFRDLIFMVPPIGSGTNKTVYKATWNQHVVVSHHVSHTLPHTPHPDLPPAPPRPHLPLLRCASPRRLV
jgi:hypothetical protein